MLVLCTINFLILLIKAKSAKKKLIKVSNIRMAISLLSTFVCALSLFFLFYSSSSSDLKYLSKNECSEDPIMNSSFVTMHDYFKNLFFNNIIASLLFLLILIV